MWIQHYDPLADWRLSTAVAAVPVLLLLLLLALGRYSAWKAALAALWSACCHRLARLRDARGDGRFRAWRSVWCSHFFASSG